MCSWTQQLDGILASSSNGLLTMWQIRPLTQQQQQQQPSGMVALPAAVALRTAWSVHAVIPQRLVCAGVSVYAPSATAAGQGSGLTTATSDSPHKSRLGGGTGGGSAASSPARDGGEGLRYASVWWPQIREQRQRHYAGGMPAVGQEKLRHPGAVVGELSQLFKLSRVRDECIGAVWIDAALNLAAMRRQKAVLQWRGCCSCLQLTCLLAVPLCRIAVVPWRAAEGRSVGSSRSQWQCRSRNSKWEPLLDSWERAWVAHNSSSSGSDRSGGPPSTDDAHRRCVGGGPQCCCTCWLWVFLVARGFFWHALASGLPCFCDGRGSVRAPSLP